MTSVPTLKAASMYFHFVFVVRIIQLSFPQHSVFHIPRLKGKGFKSTLNSGDYIRHQLLFSCQKYGSSFTLLFPPIYLFISQYYLQSWSILVVSHSSTNQVWLQLAFSMSAKCCHLLCLDYALQYIFHISQSGKNERIWSCLYKRKNTSDP